MLEQETLTITTQYLSQNHNFQNGTPSNYIIFKRQPGLGATYGEIVYEGRNSIILEPNTPVLEGKRDAVDQNNEKLHPNILVVYKGIETKDVLAYLNNEIYPKKILCTPEAYRTKVKPAIGESLFNIYQDFFMLIDECDRITKDVKFRSEIVSPMTDFFKFDQKAMISATALEPTDERFKQNDFKILKLVPENEIRQNLILTQTNNILYSLKEALKGCDEKTTFIFVNSPKLALVLIKRLGIEKESKIFTSSSGVRFLRKKHKFDEATSRLGLFAKYNFLTSRYFSAVDILLNEKPNIIMITDVLRRTFTMLDPYTDIIQIIGRFRKGISSATHIANFSGEIQWKTTDVATKYINDSYSCYNQIKATVNAHSHTQGGLDTGKEALEALKIAAFIDETGKVNSFMLDNYLLEEKTKGLYAHVDSLKERYAETEYFKIKCSKEWYDINDAAMLILEKERNTQEANQTVATILNNYNHRRVLEFWDDPYEFINTKVDTESTLKKEYPEIVDIFNKIGFEEMQKLQFDKRKMIERSNLIKLKSELTNPALILEIQSLFKVGDKPYKTDVKDKLQKVYTKFGVTQKAASSHILRTFIAITKGDKNNKKFWDIVAIKAS